MSAYKKLNRQDSYITYNTVFKSWIASGSNYSTLGISNIIGLSGSSTYIPDNSNLVTAGGVNSIDSTPFDQRLVYESIEHLYYSAFKNGIIPSASREENYLQSSFNISGSRHIGERIAVLSIPKELYGTHIKPGSVQIIPDFTFGVELDNYVINNYATEGGISSTDNADNLYTENTFNLYGSTFPLRDLDYIVEESTYVDEVEPIPGQYLDTEIPDQFANSIVDDGEGNLYLSDSSPRKYVGNVIYPHGQIIITDEVVAFYYNIYFNATIRWKSVLPIYTHTYHCRLKSSEFNHTLNKTAINTVSGDIKENISDPEFTPYITTVGLYNEANELIAVAKTSQPLPKSNDTDMVIQINLDMNFGTNRINSTY